MADRKPQALEFLKDANKLYQMQLFEEALGFYRKGVALNPLLFAGHFSIAKTLVKKGQYEEAVGSFEKALKLINQDKHPLYRSGLAGVFFMSGAFEYAARVIQPVLKDLPPDQLYHALKFLLADGQVSRATALLSDNKFFDTPAIFGRLTSETSIPQNHRDELLRQEKSIVNNMKENIRRSFSELRDTIEIIRTNRDIPENNSLLSKFEKLEANLDQEPDFSSAVSIQKKWIKLVPRLKKAVRGTTEIREKNKIAAVLDENKEVVFAVGKQEQELRNLLPFLPTSKLKIDLEDCLSEMKKVQKDLKETNLEEIEGAIMKAGTLVKFSEELFPKVETALTQMVKGLILQKKPKPALKTNDQLLQVFPENATHIKHAAAIKKLKSRAKRRAYFMTSLLVILLLGGLFLWYWFFERTDKINEQEPEHSEEITSKGVESVKEVESVKKRKSFISGNKVNIRSSPELSTSNILTQLNKGMEVSVIESIELASESDNYICKRNCTLHSSGKNIKLNAGKAVEFIRESSSKRGYFVVKVGLGNNREITGYIRSSYLEKANERWHKISWDNGEGWVYGKFIRFSNRYKELKLRSNSKKELKEKEESFNDTNENISKFTGPTPRYVVNIAAYKKEAQAQEHVRKLKQQQGYKAGYLWPPDFNSLSNTKLWVVFIGPYRNMDDCILAVESYRKIDPKVYGVKVDQQHERVEIRGRNKIKRTRNYYSR